MIAVFALLALAATLLAVLSAFQIRRLQVERRQRDDVYDSIVSHLPLVAAIVDREGQVDFLNRDPLMSIFGGLPEGQSDGEFWRSRLHADDRPVLEAALAQGLAGETADVETRLQHVDGTWRRSQTLIYPRREGSRITGVSCLIKDVTIRYALEERLRNVQKMEAMGSGIAHDFNNLLTAIAGRIELAGRELPPDHSARRHLEAAQGAAAHAGEHIRQLLSFGRRSTAQLRPLNVNEVCEEALNLLRPTIDSRIEFSSRTASDLWQTVGDQSGLVQVLVNLLLNARDVLPEGGRIEVETANVLLDVERARSHREGRSGSFVQLSVADDGPGITPEIQAHMFEPFFTTKPAGSGLGLATVYATVHQHGGWIECDSRPGGGTRFSIFLPRGNASARVEKDTAGAVRRALHDDPHVAGSLAG